MVVRNDEEAGRLNKAYEDGILEGATGAVFFPAYATKEERDAYAAGFDTGREDRPEFAQVEDNAALVAWQQRTAQA